MYLHGSLNFLAAFNVFGAAGKMAIEVSMIGFLGGTCIAFFVVMGDLAPPIIAGYLGIDNTERLRIGVLLGKNKINENLQLNYIAGIIKNEFTALNNVTHFQVSVWLLYCHCHY